MNRFTIRAVTLVLTLALATLAYAVEAPSWKAEFDRICGQTAVAEDLSIEELKQLVADCDKLLETIAASGHKQMKLYTFRTKKCKSLFEYILGIKAGPDGGS